MDRNLRIRMLLEASDRVTRPLRDMAAGSSRAAQALSATRDRLRELGRAQADIAGFRQLKNGLRATGTALQAAQGRVAQLARQMAATETPSRKLAGDFARAKREASALKVEMQDQSGRLRQVRERLSAAGIATSRLADHERRLRGEAARTTAAFEQQQRRLVALTDRQRRMASARESFGKVQGAATGLAAGGASGIATAIAVGAPIAGAASSAMNLEEGMAGVAKVTGLAGSRLQSMTNGILDLSMRIPMSAVALSNIAAAAGAAGVGMDRFGKPLKTQEQDLLAFTDAAARMGIAFDMSAEDAGGTMAKWRQAFQLPQPEVEALGDRINALTNKFGGKAADVSDIVTRIGPLGKVAGLAAPQIAALGSTLNSIGVENEIAATGIKNTLLALTKGESATRSQVKAFDALGLSATTVAKNMQTDASGTIVDVFERIAKLSPDKQASMLDSLFGSESIGAIAPLLTNLDGLKTRLGLVGDKSQYAGSMTQEFLSRINTTTGATDLAANAFQSVNIALGQALLPTIRAGALRFAHIAARAREWAQQHPRLAKGAMLLAGSLAILFGLFGVGAIAIAGIMGPIAILNAGLIAMGVAGGLAEIGLLPIIGTVAAILAAIALLAGGAYLLYANWGALSAWFAGLWEGAKRIFAAAIGSIGKILSSFNPMALLLGPFGLLFAWLGGDIPAHLAEVGRNMIRGLINGITGMLGALESTIVNAASSAANWFKAKLGIHSPSRVFMSFGGHIMQGLTDGIAGGENGPVRRLDALSRRLTAALVVGASLPAMAAPTASHAPTTGRAPAGASDRYEIHLHAAPGMDEAKLMALLERKLAEIDRRKAASRRASFADAPDWSDRA